MARHPEVHLAKDGSGTWAVLLGDVPVRRGLTRELAEEWVYRTPSQIVKGTPFVHQWRERRAAAERISGGVLPAKDT